MCVGSRDFDPSTRTKKIASFMGEKAAIMPSFVKSLTKGG